MPTVKNSVEVATILDGYTDEPSTLGVPPYIAPLPRYIHGAITSINKKTLINYLTIDEHRKIKTGQYKNNNPLTEKKKLLHRSKYLIVIAGAIVPGKYFRGTPISKKEILTIGETFNGIRLIGGAYINYIARSGVKYDEKDKFAEELTNVFDVICTHDLDATVFDFFTTGELIDRYRTEEEWNKWAEYGAQIIKQHPDYPKSLIVELEASRGCVRFVNGGCSFCSEPGFGRPIFRAPEEIRSEVNSLAKYNLKHVRVGALSCVFSYNAIGIGESETPKPNPKLVKKLLTVIRASAPELKVLHLDNANPAVMGAHLKETTEILKIILKYCTSGNILSFGLESADPRVISNNNLNSNPEEVFEMIRLVNKYGSSHGSTGLPELLPGLNFVYGLKGESKNTYKLNLEFLKLILDSGLLLRRINLRQVISSNENLSSHFNTRKYHKEFIKHKKTVREQIDGPMLRKILPQGVILKDVFMEKQVGNITFGRQIGTYPILMGIPYKVPLENFYNLVITDYGYRSATGIVTPFKINHEPLSALSALPNVGKKRAARLLRNRPYKNINELQNALDVPKILKGFEKYISFDNSI
jgi:radical SAM superfamily enzyme with C-terminal helix-hairpin-helix motif